MQRKLCRKCGVYKPLGRMVKKKNSPDGTTNECRSCHNKERKHYYTLFTEEERARNDKWDAENFDKLLAAKKRKEQNKKNKTT